jgi:hypothetical protein
MPFAAPVIHKGIFLTVPANYLVIVSWLEGEQVLESGVAGSSMDFCTSGRPEAHLNLDAAPRYGRTSRTEIPVALFSPFSNHTPH